MCIRDRGDVMFVGLDQLADVERRMAAERRHVFAGHGRMVHTLRGLVAHPADDWNTRVAEDHQRVMHIADHARELELQNGIEACLLYTSDAADERSSVDLGGRRI